jgi:hypothetical protein
MKNAYCMKFTLEAMNWFPREEFETTTCRDLPVHTYVGFILTVLWFDHFVTTL